MTSEFCQAEYNYAYNQATNLEGVDAASPKVAALLADKYSCFVEYGIEHIENDCSRLLLQSAD